MTPGWCLWHFLVVRLNNLTNEDPTPSPLWRHPRVVVTPHTAGGSPRRAGRAIATFCENLRRLADGRPLLALIDKRKGY